MLRSEVLPAPFGPMTERISPWRTSRLTSSTAVTPPNCLATPATRSCSSPASNPASPPDFPGHDADTIRAMQHFDDLETRAPQAREAALMEALPAHLAHAKKNAPGWARILKEVDPKAVNSRAALARLPVTRKSDLGDLQKAEPPLGGLNATPVDGLARLFASPGPIYEPQGQGKDWFRAG